jgi:hypothetical protein
MKPTELESFREAILRVLDERASNRFGLSVNAIVIFLAQYGFRNVAIADVNAELLYLQDKMFVAIVGKKISPENTCWRITADGRDHVAQS